MRLYTQQLGGCMCRLISLYITLLSLHLSLPRDLSLSKFTAIRTWVLARGDIEVYSSSFLHDQYEFQKYAEANHSSPRIF